MVTPVTGPIHTTESQLVGGTWCTVWNDRSVYRQKRPYTLSLPYFARFNTSTSNAMDTLHNSRVGTPDAKGVDATGGDTVHANIARNRALDSLRNSISGTVGLGIDLAQYGQAVDMVGGRLLQMRDFARNLRKGNLPAAWNDLVKDFKHPHHGANAPWTNGAKSFSNLFLEAHFGWSPLLGDIHDALGTLSEPLHCPRCVGRGHDAWSFSTSSGSGAYFSRESYNYQVEVKVGATVRINNPNVHLMNSLGLLNPLSVAWDAIPYSFVVDWVANVGNYLNSMSMFAGLEMAQPWSVTVNRVQGQTSYGNPFWDVKVVNTHFTGMQIGRGTVTPSYSLVLKPLELPSVTHAITAFSLLMQKL